MKIFFSTIYPVVAFAFPSELAPNFFYTFSLSFWLIAAFHGFIWRTKTFLLLKMIQVTFYEKNVFFTHHKILVEKGVKVWTSLRSQTMWRDTLFSLCFSQNVASSAVCALSWLYFYLRISCVQSFFLGYPGSNSNQICLFKQAYNATDWLIDWLITQAGWDIQPSFKCQPECTIRCAVLKKMLQGLLEFRLAKTTLDFDGRQPKMILQNLSEDVATTLSQLRFPRSVRVRSSGAFKGGGPGGHGPP